MCILQVGQPGLGEAKGLLPKAHLGVGLQPRGSHLTASLLFLTQPSSLPKGPFKVKGCMRGVADSSVIHVVKICPLQQRGDPGKNGAKTQMT